MKQFGSFCLDATNQCLWQNGARIDLPPKPYAVLRYLIEHPGRLVSHEELLDALWPETYVQPQVLRTYVLELRKLLADDARCPRYIQSFYKRGYALLAPVTDCPLPCIREAAAPPARAVALAGRDLELGLLNHHLRQAAEGNRQVVFVSGETGIGKTALIDRFCRDRESAGAAAVAAGQCIPGFAGKQEYYPILDALRDLGAAPAGTPLPADLCAVLEEQSRQRTLVLELEDLHWADEPTLDLIAALARRRGSARLMILATLSRRNGAFARALDPLIHDLSIRGLCAELPLGRLSKSSVADLVRARLNHEPAPEGLFALVHRQSEGNPRYSISILDHLIRERLLVRVQGDEFARWELGATIEELGAAVPGDLARTVEVEIEGLSVEEQHVLEAGSLSSIAFSAWTVAAALDKNLAEVEGICDDLARRVSFVKRAGEDELPEGSRCSFYVFAHGLYREVLYARQSPAQRALRHVRVAERLRAMFSGRVERVAREIAMNYEAAGDFPNAIAALDCALRYAIDRRAYGEAGDLQQQIEGLRGNLAQLGITPADIDAGDLIRLPSDFAVTNNPALGPAKA